ncbi:MAG: tetratricopeptide repeat protein [Bacteroidales bacterium]
MGIFNNKPTRALMLILSALVFIGVLISRHYYKGINEAVDPRVKEARLLYEKYNDYAKTNSFDSIFHLMDSIEAVYSKYPHYKNSFETGVLYNNKAASYITMALYLDSTSKQPEMQDSIFSMAETMVTKSIAIYTEWLEQFENKSREDIKNQIEPEFYKGLEQYSRELQEAFIDNRIEEIQEAQLETKRRLSVSYTNLGIIKRQRMQYEEAAKHYKTALDLWEQNLTAENNLNLLLGNPLKERSFLRKLFPPERNKK